MSVETTLLDESHMLKIRHVLYRLMLMLLNATSHRCLNNTTETSEFVVRIQDAPAAAMTLQHKK